MQLRAAVDALTRRITGYAPLRAAVFRALLRADKIVPFGRALAFDPHTWVIKETEYGFRIWVALGERSISREIMLDRYERDEVEFIRANVKPGDRVVDVGANIGFYTALFGTLVGPGGRVIACEPLDANSGSVLLRHAPVTINQGAAYLAPACALPPGHVDALVPARTLDEIVGSGPCAFIKLDAEGAEPRILAGAAETLARCRPIVLAELNPILLARVGGKNAGDVIAQMALQRYVARRLRGAPAEIVAGYDDAASINVVFFPDP